MIIFIIFQTILLYKYLNVYVESTVIYKALQMSVNKENLGFLLLKTQGQKIMFSEPLGRTP